MLGLRVQVVPQDPQVVLGLREAQEQLEYRGQQDPLVAPVLQVSLAMLVPQAVLAQQERKVPLAPPGQPEVRAY